MRRGRRAVRRIETQLQSLARMIDARKRTADLFYCARGRLKRDGFGQWQREELEAAEAAEAGAESRAEGTVFADIRGFRSCSAAADG